MGPIHQNSTFAVLQTCDTNMSKACVKILHVAAEVAPFDCINKKGLVSSSNNKPLCASP